ncbi:MAG TPA: thiol-disulfide oxidoreductase [Flavobacteriales bacterium]|nr:thiol-disulfide oxidoreductase [Flavobacteriales bacterium]
MLNFIQKRWEKFKAQSKMAKMWDVLFLVLIIAFLFPDGRNAMRRAILSTGIVGSVDANASEDLTYESEAWILQDLNGAEVQLSELKGQAIFLNFWATWCGPCKAEMPSIEALYKDMGDEVNFLIVSYEDPKVIRKFMNDEVYDFPVYFPKNGIPDQLKAEALPTTLVIDVEGRILHRSSGMSNWDSNSARELLRTALGKS